MISFYIFLGWIVVNIIFLFNFYLAAGYLAIVNLLFVLACYFFSADDTDYLDSVRKH